MSREFVYIGRANRTRRTLQAAGVDLTSEQQAAVTRVQLHVAGKCLDTNVGADPISYASGVVSAQLGLVPDLAPGQYTVRLSVFDAENPQGKAWGQFEMTALAWDCADE